MKGVETYQETAITTQTKGRLVVMLYDGAIKFLKLAIKEIQEKNPENKGKYISKALDILFELNTVLDMESGGEVAANLRKLYLFMGRHLTEANTKQDIGKIEEVIKLLEELNQSWKAVTG
jgi:flagellar protein FliS